MINSDPVARGAINHFVDKCMEGDYNIIDRESRKYRPNEELSLDEKYNFRHDILRKSFLVGKLFNNLFFEIVRTSDNQTKALNILDSINVEPITKPNGDPVKFKSKQPNPKNGKYPEWNKNDIVWVKFGDIDGGYAPVDVRALWETLNAKQYIQRFVSWLWKTGQYRVLYNFETAVSDKDIGDFLTFMRKNEANFRAPSISKGSMTAQVARDLKETDSITGLLKYYDSQILILLRIPPIDVGIPDATGRSNADAQSNNLNTHITAFKKVMEDAINFNLFPKMFKGNSLLRFAPNDRFEEEQVFKNIQIMQSIGMTPDAIEEYLADRGMYYKSILFKPPEETMNTENPRDLDTMPSRTGKAPGSAREKIGSGEQSSTRDDQL